MVKKRESSGSKRKSDRRNNLIFLVVMAVIGVGGYFYFSGVAAEYDLTRIGKGQNVVVQVHDPN